VRETTVYHLKMDSVVQPFAKRLPTPSSKGTVQEGVGGGQKRGGGKTVKIKFFDTRIKTAGNDTMQGDDGKISKDNKRQKKKKKLLRREKIGGGNSWSASKRRKKKGILGIGGQVLVESSKL